MELPEFSDDSTEQELDGDDDPLSNSSVRLLSSGRIVMVSMFYSGGRAFSTLRRRTVATR